MVETWNLHYRAGPDGIYYGPSIVSKPASPPLGTIFIETDTGKTFLYRLCENNTVAHWHEVNLRRDPDDHKIERFSLRRSDVSHNAPFPGWGIAKKVTVPANVMLRQVFGSFELVGTGGTPASITILCEDVPGSGVYQVVYDPTTTAAGQLGLTRFPFLFVCVSGESYYFDRGVGGGGVIQEVRRFHYTDFYW